MIGSATTEPTPTPTPGRTWTFTTNQNFCPAPGKWGAQSWVALTIETTVPEEAAIGTEVGMCAADTMDATYLVNVGDTGWRINADAAVTHLYYPDFPALLAPLRDAGQALSTLGPHEAAYIPVPPTAVSWDVDVPLTMTTSTVGEMTDQYAPDDFVYRTLQRWKESATVKGSPNKVLATCTGSAYSIAQTQWTPMTDTATVMQGITNGLSTASAGTSCLAAVTEYDEVRRTEQGLPPRVSPLLRSNTFEVAGRRLSFVEKAVKFLGEVLKATAKG